MPDALFRQIEERLAEPLDPDRFEQCAADLLSGEYQGLAPIAGGGDAGMDGAIPQDRDNPLPLVVTTAADVIGNLRRNLSKYIEERGEAREAVLATSQNLTARRIRNLYKKARELGFTLRNVHERAHFTNLLYRDPRWRRELLDLTGDLPPLSTLPLSRRPHWDQTILGREEEIQRLKDATEDMMLVGQPGAGKTAILTTLARNDEGLFLVDDDMGRVADAVREEQPRRIFVDDAHRTPNLLTQLRRLRREVGADFQIVAVSWPGEHQTEEVRVRLDITSESIVELRELSRDEMAEVVRTAGIAGPDTLIGEILNQAQGKPGLAVTLAKLSLREGPAELATGEFLFRDIRGALIELVGERAVTVLAGFGLGGGSGMTISSVAEGLHLPPADVVEVVTKVEAGGVVAQRTSGRLAVEPAALREALVNSMFFRNGYALPVDPLLTRVPNRSETALTLIRGKARGGGIPDQTIQDLLEGLGEPGPFAMASQSDPWTAYAWSGPDAARWILERHPSVFHHIARAALYHLPEAVIPELLHLAIGDRRELHSTLGHPLRILKDWVQSGRPGTAEALRRRRVALTELGRWSTELNADGDVIALCIAVIFDPAYHRAVDNPIDPHSLTISGGHLTAEEMRRLLGYWGEAVALLRKVNVTTVRDLDRTVHHWAFPGSMTIGGHSVSDDARAVGREGAVKLVQGIVEALGSDAGIVGWAARVVGRAELDIDLPELDRVFATLHPPREDLSGNYEVRFREHAEAARRIGRKWSTEDPDAVAAKVANIEEEAVRANLQWPSFTELAVTSVAEEVDGPVDWLAAFKAAAVPPSLLAPFLARLLQNDPDTAAAEWRRLYGELRYRSVAILTLLRMGQPPEELVDLALTDLAGIKQNVAPLCARGDLPESIIFKLLEHPNSEIAAAAAEGLDYGEAEIPEMLRPAWERAIVEYVNAEHVLRRAFEDTPRLAGEWIRARQRQDRLEYPLYFQESMEAAISALQHEERIELIMEADPEFEPHGFFKHLVGHDLELYRLLIGRSELRPVHLHPLGEKPFPEWIPLATIALDAGYSAQEVFEACLGFVWSWSGSEAEAWLQWEEAFAELEDDDDRRVREVGRIGRRHVAEARAAAAAQQERRFGR